MALFLRIHILHTSMDRLKEVSILVHLIASICTDQFNLQKHPGGKGMCNTNYLGRVTKNILLLIRNTAFYNP